MNTKLKDNPIVTVCMPYISQMSKQEAHFLLVSRLLPTLNLTQDEGHSLHVSEFTSLAFPLNFISVGITVFGKSLVLQKICWCFLTIKSLGTLSSKVSVDYLETKNPRQFQA